MKTYFKMPLSKERLDKIKILAFDMDDTLLDGHGKLSEGNKAAIMRAMEKGYHVVIATGRVFDALPKDVVAVEGVQYAVTSNGARITDMHTGKVLLENLISPEGVDAVDPYLHDEDVMIEIFFDDGVYADRKDLAHLSDFGRTSEKSQHYVLTTRQPVDDVLALLEANKDRMENINLIMADDEKRLRWLAELKKMPGITACSSTPNNIEIGGMNTSTAMRWKNSPPIWERTAAASWPSAIPPTTSRWSSGQAWASPWAIPCPSCWTWPITSPPRTRTTAWPTRWSTCWGSEAAGSVPLSCFPLT